MRLCGLRQGDLSWLPVRWRGRERSFAKPAEVDGLEGGGRIVAVLFWLAKKLSYMLPQQNSVYEEFKLIG